MVKKLDLKLAITVMAILAGILTLVSGIVFYTTFKLPIMTVVMPELNALNAWTAVAMALSAVVMAVAVVNHLAKKATWRFVLISVIALVVILETVLTVLLFRNTDLVANSTILIVLSFLMIAIYIATAIILAIQFRASPIQISKHD